MYPAITSVEDEGDYILSVVFDNGENGLLDMKPYLNFGVLKKYKIMAFLKVPVSHLTQLVGRPALISLPSSFIKIAALCKIRFEGAWYEKPFP